jgi:hypothetical protein
LTVASEIAQYLATLEKPESKDALARARAASHSLNLQTIKRAAETVSTAAKSSEQ